jgi:hypothetical protein
MYTATLGERTVMTVAPHFDKTRQTAFGAWLTECRMLTGDRQCDIAVVLGNIDRRLGNQGRPAEFETGKRQPTSEVVEALYAYFRQRLGDGCPPPPTI